MLANKLKKGDTIGIISPSNTIEEKDKDAISSATKLFEKLGYKIKFGKNAFSNTTSYGATPIEKAEDINNMFKNDKIKMVWCSKGGNNSNTTFEYINYETIKNNPKILCGFSDSTSLINEIYEKTGLVTFHGPTFKSLVTWNTDYGYRQIIKRFMDNDLNLGEENDEYISIKPGEAEGTLIGGNLSLISQLINGKYKINLDDKILFIEDLGFESNPQAISNYLYYMKQNDVFNKIKGLWIGNYEHESNISLEKIVLDTIKNEYEFPIIKSNNFGHTDKKIVIPIGIKARIIDSHIELLENCVKDS